MAQYNHPSPHPSRYPPPPPPEHHLYPSSNAYVPPPPPLPHGYIPQAYIPHAEVHSQQSLPHYAQHDPYYPGGKAATPSSTMYATRPDVDYTTHKHAYPGSYPIPQNPSYGQYDFYDETTDDFTASSSGSSARSSVRQPNRSKTAHQQGPFVLRKGHTGQSSSTTSSRRSHASQSPRKRALAPVRTPSRTEQLLARVSGRKHLKIDMADKASVNRLMILLNAPRAVLALLACIQHALRLMHMRHPGVNLPLGPTSSGRLLDLTKTIKTISDFRNCTSIGKILDVYTSGMSRRKAIEGDKKTRLINLGQFIAGFLGITLKGVGWAGRNEIYRLSADTARHKVLTGYIDRTGAKIWFSGILMNFVSMAREEIPEWKARRAQKKRLAEIARTPGAKIDKKLEDAVTAERNTIEAVKARKKRRQAALVNLAYLPVAIGYGFSKSPVTWKNISQFTILAQGLKARNYFMDALRASQALAMKKDK